MGKFNWAIFAVIMAIVVVGGGITWAILHGNSVSQDTLAKEKDAADTSQTVTGTQAGATCPDTLKNLGVRVKDNGAAIPGYLAGTVYIYDHESHELIGNITTVTGGTYTRTTSGLCGAYDAVLVTSAGTSASAKSTDLTKYANGIVVRFDNVDITLDTNQLSTLEATIDFMDQPSGSRSGYLYGSNSASTNQTTFTALNTTNVYTDAATTAKAIGASGKLEVQVTLRDTTIEKSFGDRRLNTYMCIDVGTGTVWDTVSGISVSMDSVALKKVTFTGADTTFSYIQQSEACYVLADKDGKSVSFDNNIRHTLDLSISARSGQNPSTSDDVLLYFLPQGVFKSTAGATLDQALTGVATDASTQAMAATSANSVPLLNIQVS